MFEHEALSNCVSLMFMFLEFSLTFCFIFTFYFVSQNTWTFSSYQVSLYLDLASLACPLYHFSALRPHFSRVSCCNYPTVRRVWKGVCVWGRGLAGALIGSRGSHEYVEVGVGVVVVGDAQRQHLLVQEEAAEPLLTRLTLLLQLPLPQSLLLQLPLLRTLLGVSDALGCTGQVPIAVSSADAPTAG